MIESIFAGLPRGDNFWILHYEIESFIIRAMPCRFFKAIAHNSGLFLHHFAAVTRIVNI